MSAGTPIRQTVPKPRITLNIPPPHGSIGQPTPYISTAHTSQHGPPQWPPYGNPFNNAYSTKAGGFMFKQFEGFRDFTMAQAKSGLNVGEKSAFYIYDKFSTWSRKWFTHIFLVFIVLVYSIVGAITFVAIEGPPQKKSFDDYRQAKNNFSMDLYNLAQDKKIMANPDLWTAEVIKVLETKLESKMKEAFTNGYVDGKPEPQVPNWEFWNAMFYCGTIYTTIDTY